MKKLLITACFPLAVFAKEGKYDGYTYFSVGVQNITYEENFFSNSLGENVSSSVTASSPVYISGGLILLNDTFDFSMDIASTLLPTQSEEKWNINGSLGQTNSFDALINSMEFLAHYKLTNNHRFVFGPTYKLNGYKRYAYKNQSGGNITEIDPVTGLTTNVKIGLSEERVATLYATTGYWYESIPHATPEHIRIKANALIGLPVWNQATNTSFEKVTFNSTNGYKIEANLYAGYPIMDGLEVGAFVGYSKEKKKDTDVASDGHTKWPENDLAIVQGGISLVWNFNKK